MATPQDMRVTCPSCGWILTHDPKCAGRATNCPKCGRPLALADAPPRQGPTPFDEKVNARSAETDAPSVHEESIYPSQVRSGTNDAIRTIKTAAYAGSARTATPASVIPAQAGIQKHWTGLHSDALDSRLRGNDGVRRWS